MKGMKMGAPREMLISQPDPQATVTLASCLDNLSDLLITSKDLVLSFQDLPDERLVRNNLEIVTLLIRLSVELLHIQVKLAHLTQSLNHSGPGKIKIF